MIRFWIRIYWDSVRTGSDALIQKFCISYKPVLLTYKLGQSPAELVLYNLMWMGIMDWTEHNVRMNQSTQAMCLVTALASWIIQIVNTDRANVSDVVGELGS